MLYDGLLLLAILFVATAVFLIAFGQATGSPIRYFFQGYLWLVAGLYFIWHWIHGGQTLAMQTWKIRLVDYLGQPITPFRAIGRYLLAALGLVFFGAGLFWALFDRENLFLHDRLAGTRLVMVKVT